MKAEIVRAEAEHIPAIAAGIREADKQEMWDYALLRPVEALTRSFYCSRLAWTGMIDGKPVCMFGVAPASFLSSTGLPWMIGTMELERHQLTFLRRCRPVVETMRRSYDRLENYVEESNTQAIKWLGWLGFEFGEPEPMGMFNKPFRKFWMDA